jgi:hypothetical protein
VSCGNALNDRSRGTSTAHGLAPSDTAAATVDEARRRRMLTFVSVGGGYSGVGGANVQAAM